MITADPQAVFPNQLFSALIRGNRLFLPNIGAQPEPPVQFTVNVQALVHVVNTQNNQENAAEHVNLNDQIDTETVTTGLGKLFGNDIVAIDAHERQHVFHREPRRELCAQGHIAGRQAQYRCAQRRAIQDRQHPDRDRGPRTFRVREQRGRPLGLHPRPQ